MLNDVNTFILQCNNWILPNGKMPYMHCTQDKIQNYNTLTSTEIGKNGFDSVDTMRIQLKRICSKNYDAWPHVGVHQNARQLYK